MEPVQASAITKPSGAQAIDRAADLVRQVVTASRSSPSVSWLNLPVSRRSTTSRILQRLGAKRGPRRDTNGGFLARGVVRAYRPSRERRERSRRRCLSLSRAARRTLSRDDQSRRCSPRRMVAQIAQVDSSLRAGAVELAGRSEPSCTPRHWARLSSAFGGAPDVPGTFGTDSRLELSRRAPRGNCWKLSKSPSGRGLRGSPPRSRIRARRRGGAGGVVPEASVIAAISGSRDLDHGFNATPRQLRGLPSAWPQANALSKALGDKSKRRGAAVEHKRNSPEGDVRIDADGYTPGRVGVDQRRPRDGPQPREPLLFDSLSLLLEEVGARFERGRLLRARDAHCG